MWIRYSAPSHNGNRFFGEKPCKAFLFSLQKFRILEENYIWLSNEERQQISNQRKINSLDAIVWHVKSAWETRAIVSTLTYTQFFIILIRTFEIVTTFNFNRNSFTRWQILHYMVDIISCWSQFHICYIKKKILNRIKQFFILKFVGKLFSCQHNLSFFFLFHAQSFDISIYDCQIVSEKKELAWAQNIFNSQ